MGAAGMVSVLAAVTFLHVLSFLLAVGAESRRSTGKVVPDEYDDKTYCKYDMDASTAYGVSAFFLLLLSQAVVWSVTRCLCFGRALSAGGARTCAISSFVVSLLSFLIAEACLLAGSIRNAYHTKYVGDYLKRDLSSCTSLRKGVFAGAAGMIVISLLFDYVFYWTYKRADKGGWVKHQNEMGVGMTDYGHDVRGVSESETRV